MTEIAKTGIPKKYLQEIRRYSVVKDQIKQAKKEVSMMRGKNMMSKGFGGILSELAGACVYLDKEFRSHDLEDDMKGFDIVKDGIIYQVKSAPWSAPYGKSKYIYIENVERGKIKQFHRYILCIIYPDENNPKEIWVVDDQPREYLEMIAEEYPDTRSNDTLRRINQIAYDLPVIGSNNAAHIRNVSGITTEPSPKLKGYFDSLSASI